MDEPKFTETRNAITMACAVEVHIRAAPETVWRLLTDGTAISRWNSTVPGTKRTLVLEAAADRSTDFAMEERFSGPAFALTGGLLPDFKPIFEAYANDLRREAERIERTRRHRAHPLEDERIGESAV